MDIISPRRLESFPSSFNCPVDIFLRTMGEREEVLIIDRILGLESLAIG
jgi:hypothetical protein